MAGLLLGQRRQLTDLRSPIEDLLHHPVEPSSILVIDKTVAPGEATHSVDQVESLLPSRLDQRSLGPSPIGGLQRGPYRSSGRRDGKLRPLCRASDRRGASHPHGRMTDQVGITGFPVGPEIGDDRHRFIAEVRDGEGDRLSLCCSHQGQKPSETLLYGGCHRLLCRTDRHGL